MEGKVIEREKASEVLWSIINSGILDKKIERALEEIAFCIEQEEVGYHCWGADDDICNLHVAYRKDLLTDDLKAELQAIHDKYSFIPAPYEKEKLSIDENCDEDDE